MDLPASLNELRKRDLSDSKGMDFQTFRNSLRPNFVRIWFDIGIGILVLATLPVVMALLERRHPIAAGISTVPLAVLIGYVVAYINLFFHEAAHFNIAPTRSWNDFLANLFVGILMGQDIRQYRQIHFKHHRHLGTTRDTERSYFDALNFRFVLESLTGIRTIKTALLRERVSRASAAAESASERSMLNLQLLLGLALHASVIGVLLYSRFWLAAGCWIVGVGLVYPFLNALRNLLEHRSENARADVDYTATDHGSYSRIFGDGPFAATFGAAGFNRHLLHHWEPQISYTCLTKVERYLLDTAAADVLRRHQTTYLTAFYSLFASDDHARK